MGADFIPGPDAAFDTWSANATNVIGDAPTSYGLTTTQATALSAKRTAWDSDYSAFQGLVLQLRAATETKDATRAAYEVLLRQANALAQADLACTAPMKELAGLPVHDTIRTRVPVPTTAPFVNKATVQSPGNLIIEFRDVETPDSKAKPRGVREAEIWAKVGAPGPIDGSTCEYMGSDSATPYLATFDVADAGKPVWFCLRWKNTRGELGPWGPVFAGMVP